MYIKKLMQGVLLSFFVYIPMQASMMNKVVNAIAGPRNNTHIIHNINVKNDVIDKIDPTGFLIGNDSRNLLARYLVISVDGKEIKQSDKITIKMKNEKIKVSLSIRNEVFNSKGKKNGESKFEIAGKLKNMVALLKFLRSLAESTGVITSDKAQGVGFFIVCDINPAKTPVISIGDIAVDKMIRWQENPPKIRVSLEQGIEVIDC